MKTFFYKLSIVLVCVWAVNLAVPVPVKAQNFNCICNSGGTGGSYTSLSDCQAQCPSSCGNSGFSCQPASASGSGETSKLTNPLGSNRTIPVIIGDAIKIALGVVGAIALALFVYGGFTWMTAGGNSSRVSKGREILVWATIGLMVIFLSYAILQFIINTLTGAA